MNELIRILLEALKEEDLDPNGSFNWQDDQDLLALAQSLAEVVVAFGWPRAAATPGPRSVEDA